MKSYWVYILASKKNGTIYIGITGNILNRVYMHKNALIRGFAKKYRIFKLVYLEEYSDPYAAITREKQIKKWKREWKLKLIEKDNPEWTDLSHSLMH